MRSSLLLFGVLGCAQPPQLAVVDRTPRVEVVQARAAPSTVGRTAHGVVQAHQDALLSTRLGGVFTGHKVRPGDLVQLGDPLASLDAREARAQLSLAQAGLSEAQAVRADAARTLTRIEALGDGASAAQQDKTALGLHRATAAVSRAQAQRDLAAIQLDHHTLRAPFEGQVSWTHGELGETLAPGTPLVRIVQTDSLRVSVGLLGDEVHAAQAPDSRFTVVAGPTSVAAELLHVAVAADPHTLDWPAELRLAPHAALPPGTPVRIELELAANGAGVLVPAEALHDDTVHVVVGGLIEARAVRLLGERGADLQIEGVAPGELVVVRATSDVQPGSPVRVLGEGP